jgi:hypothetical protein
VIQTREYKSQLKKSVYPHTGAGELTSYNYGLRAGRPGFDSRHGQKFSLLYSFQIGSGAHPASCPVGTGGCFPGVKWPGSDLDHSPPFSAGVKNGGAISPLPHMSSWHGA